MARPPSRRPARAATAPSRASTAEARHTVATGRPASDGGSWWSRLSSRTQHLACLALLVVVGAAFYAPAVFGGKGVVGLDTVMWRAMAASMMDAHRATGQDPLWATNPFGGMPGIMVAYFSVPPGPDTLINALRTLLGPLAAFLLLTGGVYGLVYTLTREKLAAVLAALAFGLTTYMPIILGAGPHGQVHGALVRAVAAVGVCVRAQAARPALGPALCRRARREPARRAPADHLLRRLRHRPVVARGGDRRASREGRARASGRRRRFWRSGRCSPSGSWRIRTCCSWSTKTTRRAVRPARPPGLMMPPGPTRWRGARASPNCSRSSCRTPTGAAGRRTSGRRCRARRGRTTWAGSCWRWRSWASWRVAAAGRPWASAWPRS